MVLLWECVGDARKIAERKTSCKLCKVCGSCIPEIVDEYDCGGEGGRHVRHEAIDN